MQIIFDTDNLTDADRRVLAALVGDEITETPASAPEPAPKRAPRKTATAKAPEPEPTPEPETAEEPEPEEDEDLVGTVAPTMQDALDAAGALVSEGKAPQVKAALAKAKAKKVSELTAESIPVFLDALKG